MSASIIGRRTMKAALIYGSCTGNTGCVADMMIEQLKPEIELETVDVGNARDLDPDEHPRSRARPAADALVGLNIRNPDAVVQ